MLITHGKLDIDLISQIVSRYGSLIQLKKAKLDIHNSLKLADNQSV